MPGLDEIAGSPFIRCLSPDRGIAEKRLPPTVETMVDETLAAELLASIPDQPHVKQLLSIDRPRMAVWASIKRVHPNDSGKGPNPQLSGERASEAQFGRNGEIGFHDGERSNAIRFYTSYILSTQVTSCWKTRNRDRRFRSILVDSGRGEQERHSGVGQATEHGRGRSRLRNPRFRRGISEHDAAPHIAQNTAGLRSAIDGKAPQHTIYTMSIRVAKRIAKKGPLGSKNRPKRGGRSEDLPKCALPEVALLDSTAPPTIFYFINFYFMQNRHASGQSEYSTI